MRQSLSKHRRGCYFNDNGMDDVLLEAARYRPRQRRFPVALALAGMCYTEVKWSQDSMPHGTNTLPASSHGIGILLLSYTSH